MSTPTASQQFTYFLKRYFHLFKTGLLQAWPAQLRYGSPQRKLKIIGITGTDGKTTSSSITYHLLKTADYKVGLISTVGAYINDQEIDTGFHVTQPNPAQLAKIMRQMVEVGLEYLVLEMTSHGLYQSRSWGIYPQYGALTNLDYEHLDYHLTPQNYWLAKIELLQKSRRVVLNEDLPNLNFVKKNLTDSKPIIYYGAQQLFPTAIEKALKQNFAEDYNQLNARLALTIARDIGASDKDLVAGLQSFTLPMGRMEVIPNRRGLKIIVDFAHTPQALAAALPNIRQHYTQKGGRLISIFGCAGLRDYQKRPKMGRIGAEFSDLTIFTAEDPRTENIWSIINQMKSDLDVYHQRVISIPNRAQAITFALNDLAKKGDTIVVFGKGHEQSMNYGAGEIEWNDITAIKSLLDHHEI